jgi:hypothetical protein
VSRAVKGGGLVSLVRAWGDITRATDAEDEGMRHPISELDQRYINTLERVYLGWHVWTSDAGFWYATWHGAPQWPEWITDPSRRPATVWAENPAALSHELAAEEASRMRRWLASTASSPAGALTRESLNGCIHQAAEPPDKPGLQVLAPRAGRPRPSSGKEQTGAEPAARARGL